MMIITMNSNVNQDPRQVTNVTEIPLEGKICGRTDFPVMRSFYVLWEHSARILINSVNKIIISKMQYMEYKISTTSFRKHMSADSQSGKCL